MTRQPLWDAGQGDRAMRRLWALRPLRVVALLRAYGLAGLWSHGLGQMRKNPRQLHQLWQGPPGAAAAPMPQGIVAAGAEELARYIEELRPFKRGMDGIVVLLKRDPQQMVAVAALHGTQLRGMALASQRAAGLWMVHDVFVFPSERRSGLGKALIAGIAARIGEVEGPGAEPLLWAEILPYNRASQGLFSQSGWREIAISQRRRSPQGPTL